MDFPDNETQKLIDNDPLQSTKTIGRIILAITIIVIILIIIFVIVPGYRDAFMPAIPIPPTKKAHYYRLDIGGWEAAVNSLVNAVYNIEKALIETPEAASHMIGETENDMEKMQDALDSVMPYLQHESDVEVMKGFKQQLEDAKLHLSVIVMKNRGLLDLAKTHTEYELNKLLVQRPMKTGKDTKFAKIEQILPGEKGGAHLRFDSPEPDTKFLPVSGTKVFLNSAPIKVFNGYDMYLGDVQITHKTTDGMRIAAIDINKTPEQLQSDPYSLRPGMSIYWTI